MFKILVVEDEKKHMDDAKEFFASQEDVELITASCGSEAIKIVSRQGEQIDGVITDVIMPVGGYEDEEKRQRKAPIGIGISMFASLKGIPSIFCTDLNHHSEQIEWVQFLSNPGKETPCLPLLFFSMVDDNYDRENNKKGWAKAYKILKRVIEGKDTEVKKTLEKLEKYQKFLQSLIS